MILATMDKFELQKEISGFTGLFKTLELLLELRWRLGMADDHLALDLCEFYATWEACQIRRIIGPTYDVERVPSCGMNGSSFDFRAKLPKHDTVQKAAQDLLIAVSSEDEAAVSSALREMGVFSFCPAPEHVFPKMEKIASRVSTRARQVFLVDLSLFAARVADLQRAREYVHQARTFDPSSRELYNICVIEGLIALNDGRINETIQCLDSSMKACQADVDSSVQTSLLPPNLELAEKLLERGERTAVLRHLLECHNVWQRRRPQIEEWIRIIETGEKPDFQTVGIWGDAEHPSYRLNVQWMRACSLKNQLNPAKPKIPMSPAQVLAEREKEMAEYEPLINARVKKALEYLEKDDDPGPLK